MAKVAGSMSVNCIDSSALYVSSYQTFIKSAEHEKLPHQPPPESYKTLTLHSHSPLPKFPSNFLASNRIPNTRFIVDGFRHGGPHSVTYFLTHFHADHYTGLNPHWTRGLIFCSPTTARLLCSCLRIPSPFVVPVTVGVPVRIDDSEVTLIDANHCPGAVQILFRVYTAGGDVRKYVHTGDMRYSSDMKLDPALCDFIGADTVFLDTTYCNPKFVFPSQTESVEYVANTVRRIMLEEKTPSKKPSVLFLIAVYVVGKEKILSAVAKHCDCLVYVDGRKMSVLNCLELEDSGEVFTVDASATNVHVVGWNFLGETWPFFRPNWSNMEKMMNEKGYSRVVGFVPTGWMYEVKRYSFPVRVKGCFEVHLVPYSEHSNYDELREYVSFLRPKEIIPTVGLQGLGLDSKQAASMMKCFSNLIDETSQKRRFLKGFKRRPPYSHPIEDPHVDEEEEFSEDDNGNGQENIIEMKGVIHEETDKEIVGGVKQHMDDAQGVNLTQKSALPNIIQEEIMHTKPLSKLESAPRAFFGKGARKKNVDSHLIDGPGDNAGSVVGTMEDDPGCNAIGIEEEAVEELRICLPDWVARSQLINLLTQTHGDITAAVSEFYEHETEFWGQITATCKANPVGSDCPITDNFALHKSHKQPTSVSNAAMASTEVASPPVAFDCIGFKLTDTNPCASNQQNKKSGKSSSKSRGRSGVYEWSISSRSQKKPKVPVKASDNKGKQSSITNFFKKTVMDGGTPAVGSVPKQPNITSFFKKTITDGSVPYVQSVGTCSDCTVKVPGRLQAVGFGSTPISKDPKQLHGEGVSQLLQILDGSVSEEAVWMLLDKAKGDVNVALDMYYNGCGELSVKETVSNELGSNSCISPNDLGSNLLRNCSNRDNTSGDAAETTILSIQKRLDSSAVDTNVYSVTLPLEKYNPLEHVCWHAGESAPYLHLARTFDLVEHESSKLKATVMLSNMFRSLLALSPDDILPTVYLCTNRIAPDYENVDLNIGGSTVMAAIEDAFGIPKSKLREMYNNMGDLGDVAQTCRQTQSILVVPRPLSIQQVFLSLQQISKEGGSGSNARKKDVILSLLRSCREKETKFIVRTLVRNMRIGAMMRTVMPALAQATILNSSTICLKEGLSDNLRAQLQQASTAVMNAYNILPNLNMLIPTMLSKGIEFLSTTLCISPGAPIKPMLAKITNGVPEVLKHFQGKAFTCEYKYDGQRAQVHKLKNGSIRIFSRNCEDSTSRFPDVVDIVLSSVKSSTETFVLDAEVVAVDRQNGNKIMPFQHLSSRERGRNGSAIQSQNIKVDVCIFIFDLMFANGEQLVASPLRQRRKCLKELFCYAKPGYLGFATEITVEADEAYPNSALARTKVDAFLSESISSSCEGIMVKALDDNSEYAPSKRSDSWLKVKQDYVEGLCETLDLVPIGAWHGNGRKAGWFSPFLLACYHPDSEEYQSVCRVMSGFSDAFYKAMEEFFKGERILTKKPSYYQTNEEPHVWFTPDLVWEIRGADLTISPVHQAAVGMVHPSRGISLRFPRFVRQRVDKRPEDSSTPLDIADLFHRRTRKMNFFIDVQKAES